MTSEDVTMATSATESADKDSQDVEFSESGDLTGDGGVIKEILRHGEQGWMKPESGDEVRMHYRGTLLDGTEFDSSYSRNSPFVFKLGEGKVIKGWDVAGKTMAKGEKAKLTLKPDYAYGETGSPPKIPKNATLIFEMELLSWTSKRDVFGDGTVIKSELNGGDGWERPGKLAEVTLYVIAVAMDKDGRVEGEKLHEGEKTFSLGSGEVPEAWEKVIPDMKKNSVLQLVCMKSRIDAGDNAFIQIPSDVACVRYELTLKSWRKIEDILNDGSLVKKVLSEGEGWERPGEGAQVVINVKYFLPSSISSLVVPSSTGDPLSAQDGVSLKVGDGIVIDGIDRVLQSMKLNEHALVSIAPKLAFKSAPSLLSSELSLKGVSVDSQVLVDMTLTKFEKAKDVWSMSFEEKVEEMKVRKQRGNELFKDGRYETAKKSYDRAVNFFDSPTSELKPDIKTQVNELLVQCHLNLAMCLDRMGDTPKVLTHCKKALEIQPSNVKALYRQGCAYLAQDDYYNAQSSLKYARELSPNNVDVVRKLKELKIKRLKQDAEDKKLYSNLFGRMSKLEAKEKKTSENGETNGADSVKTDKTNGTGKDAPEATGGVGKDAKEETMEVESATN